MKPLNGYEKAQAIVEQERLPVGGYLLGIIDAKVTEGEYGQTLVLAFDIALGEYANFYQKNFNQQSGEDKKWKGVYRLRVPKEDGTEADNWAMRRFKTVMKNIEESNPGYHWNWDEKTLKGKSIGGLFNNKEYEIDGRRGFYTNCHSLVPVEKIKSRNFTIPADTLLKNSNNNTATHSPVGDGFMNVPEGIAEEVPFN